MSRSDNVRLMGPLERALFLKSVDLLAGLDPSDLALFAEYATERTFAPGEPIFAPDRPVDSFHAIVEGAAHASGHEHLHGATLGPRDTPGFLGLLARLRTGLGVVATEDVTTLEFEEEALFDILEEHFSVLAAFLRNVATQVLAVRRRIPSGTYLAPLEGVLDVKGDTLDFVERLVIVRRPGTPFADASLESLAQFVRVSPVVRYEAGTTLWKVGDRSDWSAFLVRGTVACTTQWGFSRFRVGPGYPLGNLERLGGESRWFTAVTETPVLASRVETETFFDLLEDHFELGRGILSGTARNAIRVMEEEAAAGSTGEAAGGRPAA